MEIHSIYAEHSFKIIDQKTKNNVMSNTATLNRKVAKKVLVVEDEGEIVGRRIPADRTTFNRYIGQ